MKCFSYQLRSGSDPLSLHKIDIVGGLSVRSPSWISHRVLCDSSSLYEIVGLYHIKVNQLESLCYMKTAVQKSVQRWDATTWSSCVKRSPPAPSPTSLQCFFLLYHIQMPQLGQKFKHISFSWSLMLDPSPPLSLCSTLHTSVLR